MIDTCVAQFLIEESVKTSNIKQLIKYNSNAIKKMNYPDEYQNKSISRNNTILGVYTTILVKFYTLTAL